MRLNFLFFCVITAFASPTALVDAQTPAVEPGIVVNGTGEVRAKPNLVEIGVQNSASAELTGDAIVKYRDALRRTLASFESLGIDDLKIEQRNLKIASGSNPQQAMAVFGGNQAEAAKPEIHISRKLVVELRGIDSMEEEEMMETVGRILDAAKDSGASVGASGGMGMVAQMMLGNRAQGASSVLTFVLEDDDALREQAYEKAFEQARSRAKRLAKLAGAQLGPVLAVREMPAAQPSNENPAGIAQAMMSAVYGIRRDDEGADSRVTSDSFGEIPMRVSLQVRFALRDGAHN